MSRNILTTKTTDPELESVKNDQPLGKVIFTIYNEKKCALLIKNDRLIAMQVYSEEASLIDAIYIARIKDVVPNIDAYFVEIQKDFVCFLPAKACKTPILINRDYDGRLLQGDHILVRVTKAAQKTKPPMVSGDFSKEKYAEYVTAGAHKACFTCLKEPYAPWFAALKDLACENEYAEIVTDQAELYQHLENAQKDGTIHTPIRLYHDEKYSISKLYSLNTKIKGALERRIWLKSGAYLIIEHTEALTVIDVNSGKYEARKAKDDFSMAINTEAAKEIALQMRLRNLSGMIIVDFISMKDQSLEDELLHFMKECVRESRVATKIVDITPLGLMEITRQKNNRPLREYFQ